MVQYQYWPDTIKLYMVQAVQSGIKPVLGKYCDVCCGSVECVSLSYCLSYIYEANKWDSFQSFPSSQSRVTKPMRSKQQRMVKKVVSV